jgi:hypothetical protein
MSAYTHGILTYDINSFDSKFRTRKLRNAYLNSSLFNIDDGASLCIICGELGLVIICGSESVEFHFLVTHGWL